MWTMRLMITPKRVKVLIGVGKVMIAAAVGVVVEVVVTVVTDDDQMSAVTWASMDRIAAAD